MIFKLVGENRGVEYKGRKMVSLKLRGTKIMVKNENGSMVFNGRRRWSKFLTSSIEIMIFLLLFFFFFHSAKEKKYRGDIFFYFFYFFFLLLFTIHSFPVAKVSP